MKSKKRKSKKQSTSKKRRGLKSRKRQSAPSIDREKLRQLAFTSTGEVFQPIRIHYEMAEVEELETYFSGLRCMSYDARQRRWVWLYTEEARKLRLKNQPGEENPVVLGEFIFQENNEVFLNLRSLERATEAIVFFDRHIQRKVLRLTNITIINKVFSLEEAISTTRLGQFFERSEVTERDPEAITRRLLETRSGSNNEIQRLEALKRLTDELASEPDPEIEKFPANYYRDGINAVRLSLTSRQIVAIEHWKGNLSYTAMDSVHDMISRAGVPQQESEGDVRK